LPFLKPIAENLSILVLNGSGTSIRFKHGKTGRKMSEGNAAMYPL
jgi:hypothetical protein